MGRIEHIFKFHDRRIDLLFDKLKELEGMIISVSNRLDFINGQAVDEALKTSGIDLNKTREQLQNLREIKKPDKLQELEGSGLTERQIYLAGFHDAWVQLRPDNWKQDQIDNAEHTYNDWVKYDKPKLKNS